MGYVVLARKYRPQLFEEVIGQTHITKTLSQAISANRFGHAYLFSGPRGVGKTSTARILAKALNCEKGPTPRPCNVCSVCKSIMDGSNLDVIEIDAASNRGIDDVRQLREYIRLAPTGGSRYKVYIIDEVHMLTTEAFNALLKTLEEPPSHAVFVLATTEKHKVPLTIISRCQQFDFRRIPIKDIVKQLEKIIENEEGIKIVPEERAAILNTIARAAFGSIRDAEVLLDQLISFSDGQLSLAKLHELLGVINVDALYNLLDAVVKGEVKKSLEIVSQLIDFGIEFESFVRDLLDYFRSLMILKTMPSPNAIEELLGLPDFEEERRLDLSKSVSLDEIFRMMKLCTKALALLRSTLPGRIILEMLVLDLIFAKHGSISKEIKKEELKSNTTTQLEVTGVEAEPIVIAQSKNELAQVSDSSNKNIMLDNNSEKKEVITTLSSERTQTITENLNDLPKEKNEKESSLETIITKWDELCARVKKTKPALSAYLSLGKIEKLENNTIVIGYEKQNKFFCEQINRKENKSFIESILLKLFGLEYKIQAKIIKTENSLDSQKSSEEEKELKEQIDQKKEPSIELQPDINNTIAANPMLQKIIETFGAEIVSVRQLANTAKLDEK